MPDLLSELFSEQLGYPITPADLGLPVTDGYELGLRYSETIAATGVVVAQLGRYDSCDAVFCTMGRSWRSRR